MVSTADGCAGAPSFPAERPEGAWDTLTYPDQMALPKDGVIVLRGLRHSTGGVGETGGVTVTVTDAAANPVPGTFRLEPTDGQWPAVTYVVWVPDAPFQPGDMYTVGWQTPYGAGIDDSATFSVDDATSLPSNLKASALSSDRTYALTGPQIRDCQGTDCQISPFGSVEIQPYGMRVKVDPPTAPNQYFALSLREVSGKGTFVETYDTPWSKHRQVMATPWLAAQELTAWFKDELPEYCVELVQRDLRSGAESAQEVCVPRPELPASGDPMLNGLLKQCSSPPDGHFDAWCSLNPSSQQCAALTPDAAAPDSGAGVDAGTVAETGSSSSGCSVRNAPRPGQQGMLLVALLSLPLLRRRRKC
jgi:MYXO-CTERM domain-containing protein